MTPQILSDIDTARDLLAHPDRHSPIWLEGAAGLLQAVANEVRDLLHAQSSAKAAAGHPTP